MNIVDLCLFTTDENFASYLRLFVSNPPASLLFTWLSVWIMQVGVLDGYSCLKFVQILLIVILISTNGQITAYFFMPCSSTHWWIPVHQDLGTANFLRRPPAKIAEHKIIPLILTVHILMTYIDSLLFNVFDYWTNRPNIKHVLCLWWSNTVQQITEL